MSPASTASKKSELRDFHITWCRLQHSTRFAFMPGPAEVRARASNEYVFVVEPACGCHEKVAIRSKAHGKRVPEPDMIHLRGVGR